MPDLIKRILLVVVLLNICVNANSQKETNLLKKHEISLLKLLLSDSTHNSNFVVSNVFNFGLDNQLFTNSAILKKGGLVLVQPQGTGRLYKASLDKGELKWERLDQTVHSGVNFFAQNFFIKDTLYQYGGLGFWQIRGLMSYFSKQTNQWELLQTNKAIPCFFDEQRDVVMHYDDQRATPKFYISNSYYYPNYPNSFESAAVDSCYEFNFHTREWHTLGKINPDFKKLFLSKNARSIEVHIDDFLIFQSQLDFYWLNFEKNQTGLFNAKENDRLRQTWLSFYNIDKTRQQTQFQFNIGNDLYLAKINPGGDLEWIKTPLDLKAISTKNAIPIYINTTSFTENISGFIYNQKGTIVLCIGFILFFIGMRTSFFSKKSIPKEVVTILYQNFFASLNIIEKELIEALYQSNLKGEELSTKSINKIIGVQQKDTLTQNKSRSDHFIKINQKFKMATQHPDALIVKNRDAADKRQYNYDLNEAYIKEIEKLLKD